MSKSKKCDMLHWPPFWLLVIAVVVGSPIAGIYRGWHGVLVFLGCVAFTIVATGAAILLGAIAFACDN